MNLFYMNFIYGECGRRYLRHKTERTWPWIASLRQQEKHFCGAVLIDDRILLTAAQCIVGLDIIIFLFISFIKIFSISERL